VIKGNEKIAERHLERLRLSARGLLLSKRTKKETRKPDSRRALWVGVSLRMMDGRVAKRLEGINELGSRAEGSISVLPKGIFKIKEVRGGEGAEEEAACAPGTGNKYLRLLESVCRTGRRKI